MSCTHIVSEYRKNELPILRVAVVTMAMMWYWSGGSSVEQPTVVVDWSSLSRDLAKAVAECNCATALVRLAWHDAGTYSASDGTGGSHAAQRFPEGESQHTANTGLAIARSLLQPFKEKYPQLSHADLWAFGACVAIRASGGPLLPFRYGRRDALGYMEGVEEGRLPDGTKGAKHTRAMFARQGVVDDASVVALWGAYMLLRSHAVRASAGDPWTSAPLRFDNAYFADLLDCKWKRDDAEPTHFKCERRPGLTILSTDRALATEPNWRKHARRFAGNESAFFESFARAFPKLLENGHAGLVAVPTATLLLPIGRLARVARVKALRRRANVTQQLLARRHPRPRASTLVEEHTG